MCQGVGGTLGDSVIINLHHRRENHRGDGPLSMLVRSYLCEVSIGIIHQLWVKTILYGFPDLNREGELITGMHFSLPLDWGHIVGSHLMH